MITSIHNYKKQLIVESATITIQELKKKQQNELTDIYNKYGIFYAFNKEQFDQSKTDGVTYLKGSSGMFIPKENKDAYLNDLNEFFKNSRLDFLNNIPKDKFIQYELSNHEVYYTGDYEDILDVVQHYYPDVTIEDIKKVYLNTRHLFDY